MADPTARVGSSHAPGEYKAQSLALAFTLRLQGHVRAEVADGRERVRSSLPRPSR